MKEKETHWSEVLDVYTHQVREGREACLTPHQASTQHKCRGKKLDTHLLDKCSARFMLHWDSEVG